MLQAAAGLNIPRGDRREEGDMVISVPVTGLEGLSFKNWAVRLQIKQYGLGFRSLKETCGPACLATLKTSIPRMKEISPAMSVTWGGDECWGMRAVKETRWRTVLSPGCLEGVEMVRAWDRLTLEAREALAEHRPKKDRPGIAWRQRDKISSSWYWHYQECTQTSTMQSSVKQQQQTCACLVQHVGKGLGTL